MVGPRAGGQVGLLGAAHRREHGGVRPSSQLDRGVAHRPCAARDEHGAALQRAGPEAERPVLGHGQCAVRGEERDPECGAEVERRGVGQVHHLVRRHQCVLLRRTLRTLVRRLPDPDPQPQQGGFDSGPDGVDDAGAVLVRGLGRVDRVARPRAAA